MCSPSALRAPSACSAYRGRPLLAVIGLCAPGIDSDPATMDPALPQSANGRVQLAETVVCRVTEATARPTDVVSLMAHQIKHTDLALGMQGSQLQVFPSGTFGHGVLKASAFRSIAGEG